MSLDIEWQRTIREDLATFRDLATEAIESEVHPHRMTVEWRQGGRKRTATFRNDGERTSVEVMGRRQDYRTFLSGAAMADLRSLAQSIYEFGQERWFGSGRQPGRDESSLDHVFVPTRVRELARGRTRPIERDGLEYFSKLNEEEVGPAGATQVTFLLADAGQGKSQLLRRAAVNEAERYLAGEVDSLLLYVDAQSSGLALLNQAVAKSLDDYRGDLLYQNVQPLVREGLLVLVVDGFDELIGTRGSSQDAFTSLTAFVAALDGRGSVVASGRSAYYEQEFATRADRYGVAGHDVRSVEVLNWEQNEYFAYCELVATEKRVDRQPLRELWYSHKQLLAKPFFAREVVSEWLRGDSVVADAPTAAIVWQIIRGYLSRESGKLLREREQVTDVQSLDRFYREIAEEMWTIESRELDPESLRTTAELVFDNLDEFAIDMLVQRAPYLALLTVGNEDLSTIRFEHEMFYSYFVASALSKAIRVEVSGLAPETRLLEHALIPREAADFVAQRWTDDGLGIGRIARVLAGAGARHSRRSHTVRQNCGALLAASLRTQSPVKDVILEHALLQGESLVGIRLDECRLADVSFKSCDLSDAIFSECSADFVSFSDVTISASSVLDIQGIDWGSAFTSLRVHEGDRVRSVFDPAEIASRLRGAGFPGIPDAGEVRRNVPEEVVAIVDRLADAYSRMNPIGDRHTDLQDVFGHEAWPEVRDALLAAGLIEAEDRAVSGPKQSFYRKKFDPTELMRGLDRVDVGSSIESFWMELGRGHST
jgi:hypothetical protein